MQGVAVSSCRRLMTWNAPFAVGLALLGSMACGQAPRATSAVQTAGMADASNDDIVVNLVPVETPAEIVAALGHDALFQRAEALDAPTPTPTPASPAPPVGDGSVAIPLPNIDVATLVNLGKTFWQVISDNRPVANVSFDFANALPKGVTAASDLAGFSDLQMKSFRLYGVNFLGMTVYDVVFTVVHQYGGRLGDKGHYIASAAVLPSKVDVAWGYKLNLKVSNVSYTNVGTADDPVASLSLALDLGVDSFLKHHAQAAIFQIRGDRADVIHSTIE